MALRRRILRDKLPDAVVMLGVVTLTGCVGFAEPRPVEVSLDRSEVTVRLSDMSRCTGPVAATRGANGQVLVSGAGALRDCPVPLSYRVTADAGLNPLRLVFEEVFGARPRRAIAPRRGRDHGAGRPQLESSPRRRTRTTRGARAQVPPSDASTMPRRRSSVFLER
jgi:hypothetical protein